MNKVIQILSMQNKLSATIRNSANLHEMLQAFVDVSMIALDLNAVHLFLLCNQYQEPICTEEYAHNHMEHYLEVSTQSGNQVISIDSLTLLAKYHLGLGASFSVQKFLHGTYHFFSIPSCGVMIFQSIFELDEIVKKSLVPIFKKLSLSCCSYIVHRQLTNIDHLPQQPLSRYPSYDELTQVFNRQTIIELLKLSLIECKNNYIFCALFFIDLNEFNLINDALGSDIGDEILRQIASRLKCLVSEKDVVARFGNDEFLVLLPDLGRIREDAEFVANAIGVALHNMVEEPFVISGSPLYMTCSIGYEIFSSATQSHNDVIKNANLAMCEAKARRQRIALRYESKMTDKLHYRISCMADLKNALQNKEFVLYYQPQFNLANDIIGAEVLLRWNNAKRIGESPALYISVAEDNDLIIDIGRWILAEVCKQLKILEASGLPATFKKIAINVSSRELAHEGFFENIFANIKNSGIDASKLVLEITENVFINHVQDVAVLIKKLKSIGIDCAIDDFGTGYSSLAYLKHLPVTLIKIDQSFVRDIQNNAENYSIAKMIISLGESLGMDILAEGVECEVESQRLIELGCKQFQGYYFSHPLPFEEFAKFLVSSRQC